MKKKSLFYDPRDKILNWIATFAWRNYRQVIGGGLILAVLSGFLLTRINLQSDVLNLLPSNAPATGAFVTFLRDFGSADSLYIVLERESGGDVESFGPFAEVLARHLMETGEFNEIHGRLDPVAREKIAGEFIPKAFLYLSMEDLKEIAARLEDGAIQRRIRELKKNLHSPIGAFATQLTAADPLDLLSVFRKYLPMMGGADSEGLLLSPDRKMMLLIGKPKGSAPDVAYDELLLAKVGAAIKASRETAFEGGTTFADLRIGLAGGYVTALEDSRTIKKELFLNFTVSLLGVLGLFIVAFGWSVSFFYALIPLLLSPLFTLGFSSPFLGRLSESAGAFSAIILGLSIDFIILLYSRYLEERNGGQSVPEALRTSLANTGLGVLTAAVTTNASYYTLFVSDFRGIKEMGFLTGTGILVSMLCSFLIFPALVVWRERGLRKEKRSQAVYAFGLERLGPLALRHPGWTLLLSIGVTLGCVGGAFQAKLNNDPRKLRPASYPSLALEERMQEKMGEGREMIVLLTKSRDPQEALELQGRLKILLDEAIASGLPISRYESLASFIPPFSQQKRNLEWIEAQGHRAFDPDRVVGKLRQILPREGLETEPFEPGLKMLYRMVANRETLTWENFQGTPLRELGNRFLRVHGDGLLSAVYVLIYPEFWNHPKAGSLLSKLRETIPGLQITGSKLVQDELSKLMAREAWTVLLIALIAVGGLIYLDFRSLRITLLALLPVMLACVWTLGLMGLFHVDLNFMNLIVFTMILGVGVDYVIYILHRWLERGATPREIGLTQVGKSVLVAGLATLIGFGSLILSSYPGLQSMGVVALLGVGFSFLLSMTLIPVLLQKTHQRSR
jgi:predicted RND superfamily exporter protein